MNLLNISNQSISCKSIFYLIVNIIKIMEAKPTNGFVPMPKTIKSKHLTHLKKLFNSWVNKINNNNIVCEINKMLGLNSYMKKYRASGTFDPTRVDCDVKNFRFNSFKMSHFTYMTFDIISKNLFHGIFRIPITSCEMGFDIVALIQRQRCYCEYEREVLSEGWLSITPEMELTGTAEGCLNNFQVKKISIDHTLTKPLESVVVNVGDVMENLVTPYVIDEIKSEISSRIFSCITDSIIKTVLGDSFTLFMQQLANSNSNGNANKNDNKNNNKNDNDANNNDNNDSSDKNDNSDNNDSNGSDGSNGSNDNNGNSDHNSDNRDNGDNKDDDSGSGNDEPEYSTSVGSAPALPGLWRLNELEDEKGGEEPPRKRRRVSKSGSPVSGEIDERERYDESQSFNN